MIGQTGELLGHNMFAYTKNNPISMRDENGFRPTYTMDEETDEMIDASLNVMNKFKSNVKSNYVRPRMLNKTFYGDVEGPNIDLNGGVEAKLISGEVGLAKVYDEYKYGQWALISPYANSDIGLDFDTKEHNVKASLYGKLALFGVNGSIFLPLPGNQKLEIGVEADMFSVGGGLKFDWEKKEARGGYHMGFGADLMVKLH